MILFLEDWFKYPLAIIDTKTKNKTFLRLAGIYKKMGIKNHAFLLALHNPELQNVDPYNPDLTDQQKIMIAKEEKENPWYYFRELMRVPSPAGSVPMLFNANRANIAFLWLAFNHITSYLIQPRQTGKSLIGNGLDSYMLNTHAFNSEISLVTKDEKLRTRTSAQIRELIELLPPFLQFLSNKDIKNNERITIKALQNSINLFIGRNDKKAADNLGRGMTSPMIRVDEFAYIYNIHITLPVLLAASTAAREIAEINNSPYYTTFTTTPGKLNTKEGLSAYEIYKHSVRWTEKLLDAANEKELNNIIDKNSTKYKIVLLEFNHKQLGFTDAWLRKRLEASLADGEAAESDFFMKWVAGNTQSPIPKHILEVIVNSRKKDPNIEITKYGYVINWFVNDKKLADIRRNKFLIIGLDTSDALGGTNDDIGLVIRDSSTGAVVGAGKYNETNLATFADFLVHILEVFPNSILIPERRSSAVAILDFMFRIMIIKNMNPFKRIFNWIVNNLGTNPQLEKKVLSSVPTINELNKHKRQFGFATSGSGETSRNLLYGNIFKSAISYTADTVYYDRLVNQLAGLRIKNNRIDHSDDEHDDLVIAWLLAMYVILMGKNTHIYGLQDKHKLNIIVDSEVMSNSINIDKDKVQQQLKLKQDIETIIQQLRNTNNEILAMRLISKIRTLEKDIDTSILSNINIDTILQNIKIAKRILKNKI